MIQRYNIRYLSIQDELFGHDIGWVKRFCERIKPYGIRWFAQFRVTDITEELVKILKDSNCATIGFGIESADNRILKSMNKKITIEDTERALEIVYKAGIGIQGCLIFGDIAETIETAKNSIRWWHDHKHYGLQLSVVVTYPGTALFQYACDNGLIKDPVQFIKDSCPTVKLSKMTIEEYGWVLEQILDSQRSDECIPADIRSVNLDDETAYLHLCGVCPSCHSENTWENIRLFIADSIVCRNCGRRLYAPIPRVLIDRIANNVEILLSRFGRMAFWGINSYFYGLCKNLPEKLQTCADIYCVDKSEIRHGIRILNTTVKPTQCIAEKNIPCIVVAVPQYFANLKPMIEREFPHAAVFSITQLISRSFSCDAADPCEEN